MPDALYSAIGHQASAYGEPEYQAVLLGATKWAMQLEGEGCGPNRAMDEERNEAAGTSE